MKSLFLNKTIQFLSKYQNYSEEEVEKLKYGLEGIYLTYTKMIVILALAIILNMLKEVIAILIFFNIIRYFGFGVHAKKSSECLVSSILCFILLPYILLNLNITKEAMIIISIICMIDLVLFAPADTIKRPFKNKKKRIIRKLLTIVVAILYVSTALLIQNVMISKILIISIIIEAIIVNPITYKLLNQPFNNYKKV